MSEKWIEISVVAVEFSYGRPNPTWRRIRFMGYVGDDLQEVRLYHYVERARIGAWDVNGVEFEDGSVRGRGGQLAWASDYRLKGWRGSAGHYVAQMLGSDYGPIAHLLSQPGPTTCRLAVEGDPGDVHHVKKVLLVSGRSVDDVDWSTASDDDFFSKVGVEFPTP